MNMEQKAYDAKTGDERDLTINEKLLIQNDQHLQAHIKMIKDLLSLEKRIESLEKILPEICNSINNIEKQKIIDPNTNL